MAFNRASVRNITTFVCLLFTTFGALPNTGMVAGDANGGDPISLIEAVFKKGATNSERYSNILTLYMYATSHNSHLDGRKAKEINDDLYGSLAHWAATVNLEILRSWASLDVNLLKTTDSINRTLLHNAVIGNNLRAVKYLVEEQHLNIEAKDAGGYTPLALAVEKVERVALMKYLVDERKADLNCRDSRRRNLLHLAAAASNLVALKYLVDEKNMSTHLEEGDFTGNSVAMVAVSDGGDLDVLKYLIEEKHVNTSTRNQMDLNLLHAAADCFNLPIVKYLEEKHNFDIMEPVSGEKTIYTWIKRWFSAKYTPISLDLNKGKEVLAYLEKRMVDKLTKF